MQDGSAAERDDTVAVGECPVDRVSFEYPEVGLTVVDEDVGYGLPRVRLHLRIGVDQRDAERRGDQRADRRLARAGRPDEDDNRRHVTTRVSR